MYGYVYLTTDLTNNKIYVGQHKSEKFDESYLGSGQIIRAKIKKYGKENFSCEILEKCDTEQQLNDREIYWIKELNSRDLSVGYNIATGGTFGDSGYHLEMLGKHQSEKQKRITSEYWKTHTWSEESRKKLSKSKIGNRNAAGNIGYIHIFKDDVEIKVKENELQSYLDDGWKRGHKPYSEETQRIKKERYKNSTYISKDGIIKNVVNDELDKYLNDGWEIGREHCSDSKRKKISDAQKGRICITDGNTNKYINKEEWPNYEKLGYFKMCKQTYKKIYENTQ